MTVNDWRLNQTVFMAQIVVLQDASNNVMLRNTSFMSVATRKRKKKYSLWSEVWRLYNNVPSDTTGTADIKQEGKRKFCAPSRTRLKTSAQIITQTSAKWQRR
jgi:hypothetical protein